MSESHMNSYNYNIQMDLEHLSAYEEVQYLDEKMSELDEMYAKAGSWELLRETLEEARDGCSKQMIEHGTNSEKGEEASIKTGFFILILKTMDEIYEKKEESDEV